MTGGSRRELLRPGWLALHVVAVVALAVQIGFGLWQWGRGEATGGLRNYLYGLEWWAFAVLTLLGYVKFCLDETAADRAPRSGVPPPPLPPAAPADAPVHDDEDPELAAWNARLAELARRDAESRR